MWNIVEFITGSLPTEFEFIKIFVAFCVIFISFALISMFFKAVMLFVKRVL